MSDTEAPSGEEQPQGRDLSDGLLDYRSGAEKAAITNFIDEVTIIRLLRVRVAWVLVAVLMGLGAALGVTIWSFSKQIDRATPEIRHLVEAARDGASAPGAVASVDPASADKLGIKATAVPASAASAPVVVTAVDTPAVTTSVKIDIASMAGSIVAVISILVIAISAIAISLLRATFGLTPHRREATKADYNAVESKDSRKDDGGLPLPAMELLNSLVDCVKSVAGKLDK